METGGRQEGGTHTRPHACTSTKHAYKQVCNKPRLLVLGSSWSPVLSFCVWRINGVPSPSNGSAASTMPMQAHTYMCHRTHPCVPHACMRIGLQPDSVASTMPMQSDTVSPTMSMMSMAVSQSESPTSRPTALVRFRNGPMGVAFDGPYVVNVNPKAQGGRLGVEVAHPHPHTHAHACTHTRTCACTHTHARTHAQTGRLARAICRRLRRARRLLGDRGGQDS